MKELMLKLGTYIIKNKVPFRRSDKGFISNDISAVQTHTEAIEKLCLPLGWKLLEMKPKYNPETKEMSPHMFYLGACNSNDCTDANDFVIE